MNGFISNIKPGSCFTVSTNKAVYIIRSFSASEIGSGLKEMLSPSCGVHDDLMLLYPIELMNGILKILWDHNVSVLLRFCPLPWIRTEIYRAEVKWPIYEEGSTRQHEFIFAAVFFRARSKVIHACELLHQSKIMTNTFHLIRPRSARCYEGVGSSRLKRGPGLWLSTQVEGPWSRPPLLVWTQIRAC